MKIHHVRKAATIALYIVIAYMLYGTATRAFA